MSAISFSSILLDPSPIIGCLLVTYCCSVDLIAVTLACDNATSKLVAVVRSADVNAEKRVDKSLVQIRKLKFCQF